MLLNLIFLLFNPNRIALFFTVMNQLNFTNIRSDWQEKGYILLKNAIQSSDVTKYLAAVDDVIKKARAENSE